MALKIFGLFIVLPVLSIYALEMDGATPFLAGLVVGGYAFTQALFQIPFGLMSDKIGRKKTLLVGLLIFIAGSIICALSTNIYMLLLGRFLQGGLGAIWERLVGLILGQIGFGRILGLKRKGREEGRPKALIGEIIGGEPIWFLKGFWLGWGI